MKNVLLCFLLFFAFSSLAQTKVTQGKVTSKPIDQTKGTQGKSTTTSINQTKGSQDKRFIGSWSGSEKDQQLEGLEKHWIQHRFEDGTYIILFTVILDGEAESSVEKGRWWVVNNEFHELHNESGLTDVYSFTFLDENRLKLKSKFLLGEKNDSYEVVDTRLTAN